MGRWSREFRKRKALEARATEILTKFPKVKPEVRERPKGWDWPLTMRAAEERRKEDQQKCSQCDGVVTKSLRGFCDVCDDTKFDAEVEEIEAHGEGDEMSFEDEMARDH